MKARATFPQTAVFSVFALILAGLLAAPAAAEELPFELTEKRERCDHYEPLKQPFFGETHLHTAYSFDASLFDTRNTPADAYRFAKGEPIGLPPFIDSRSSTGDQAIPPEAPLVTPSEYCMPGEQCQYMATRTTQLPAGRALDFAAVTDHSEQFGEYNICFFEPVYPCDDDSGCPEGQSCQSGLCAPDGHNAIACQWLRDAQGNIYGGGKAALVGAMEDTTENPVRPPFCTAGVDSGSDSDSDDRCISQARTVWQQIQRDAEEAYDRTSACEFTSFIAYEYTATPSTGACKLDGSACWEDADCAGSGDDQKCLLPSNGDSYPGSGGSANLHRNIIFRNHQVPATPISNVEAPVGCGVGDDCNRCPGVDDDCDGYEGPKPPLGSPEQMLFALKAACQDDPALPDCDVLSIPHNANLSAGAMFLMPESLDEARIRRELEPLTELIQIKGASECRWEAGKGDMWGTTDEECAFELVPWRTIGGSEILPAERNAWTLPPSSYVRNALKNGLAYEQANGVNPFKLGFVGGLDNHNGTPGQSDEQEYARTGAHGLSSYGMSFQILEDGLTGLQSNGGALTVAWAEENSRDSIFHALKQRETYVTSGTRPILRFFGGFDLPEDMCSGEFAAAGYQQGVPMGGCLGVSGEDEDCLERSPGEVARFALSATMDPGWRGRPGTQLQRAQIIKGWVDSDGEVHEKTYEVAGSADSEAGVNLATCEPKGSGHPTLCTVWTDPDFDPNQRAFYYARVLENPSCRWNQYFCNARQVDCAVPPGLCQGGKDAGERCHLGEECESGACQTPDSYSQYEYQRCCSSEVPSTVQQRAWSSPIWYRP